MTGWDRRYAEELGGLEAGMRRGRVDVKRAMKINEILQEMEWGMECISRKRK